MAEKALEKLERELDRTWTESLSINTESNHPLIREVRTMVENRNLSISLRKQLRMN